MILLDLVPFTPMVEETPLEKLFKFHDYNAVQLLQAYDNGIENIETFKEEFKQKLLELLEEDLAQTKNKFKEKVEKRILRAKNIITSPFN